LEEGSDEVIQLLKILTGVPRGSERLAETRACMTRADRARDASELAERENENG